MEWFEHNTLIQYHIFEEALIASICLYLAWVIGKQKVSSDIEADAHSRLFLVKAGMQILALSGFIHAFIHYWGFSNNLLYQTLAGYCLGLFILALAFSSEKPQKYRYIPFIYPSSIILLFPDIYTYFPIFSEFRPLVWIMIAYLSGLVGILFAARFYLSKSQNSFYSALGFLLVFFSSIFIFFPDSIGAPMWLLGHLLRPIGFIVLLYGINRDEILKWRGSILYKTIATFNLFSILPVLLFGSFLFYENVHPFQEEWRRIVVFMLMLFSFCAAFIFGLIVIIRLLRPILVLRKHINLLVESNFNQHIDIINQDEIGDLANAFNEMVLKLSVAVDERERLSRLAATGELAATLAHEIRNPLNAIEASAKYIASNYEGDLISTYLKIISDEGARINKLSRNLLAFAKQQKTEIEANNINELVKETVELLKTEAAESKVILNTDLSRDVHLVSFDKLLIKQVLINLIVNAIDSMKKGGEIMVSTLLSDEHILLSVSDQGDGIAKGDLKKIFNPFFTTKTRGTGLGLAISKKIVAEHNGELSVESILHSGSCFTLKLLGGS